MEETHFLFSLTHFNPTGGYDNLLFHQRYANISNARLWV